MKKLLLFMAVVAFSFSGATAQETRQTLSNIEVGKQLFQSDSKIEQQKKLSPVSKLNSDFKKSSYKPASALVDKSNFKSNNASNEILNGTLAGRGDSEFNGKMRWDVTVRKDASDNTKYWFTNFIPESTNKDIYATLENTTLSFPLGQLAFSYDGIYEVVSLRGIATNGSIIETGSITAVVDEAAGTITFTEGFGARIEESDKYPGDVGAWIDIIYPGAIFYTPASVPINALYRTPQGTLYMGMSQESYGLGNNMALAPAYSTWNWGNKTDEEEATYLWNYGLFGEGEESLTSTTKDLVMEVANDEYVMPTLTSTMISNTNSSQFTLGNLFEEHANALISAGGGSFTSNNRLYNPTNANPDYSQIGWRFSEGVYVFGTGTQSQGWAIEELITVYEKPQSTLYFEGIDVFCSIFTAPEQTELTLYVVTIDRNDRDFPIMKDTLAVSRIFSEDVYVVDPTSSWRVLQFRELYAKDEDGFEELIPALEIEDEFVFILSGFNKPGVTLSVLSEMEDKPAGTDGKQNSFFRYIHPTTGAYNLSYWTNVQNTMLFSLYHGYYSYIHSEVDEVVKYKNGGEQTFNVIPLFGIMEPGEIPNWIQIEQNPHYVTGNWGTDVTVKVAPLGENEGARSADIVLYTLGAQTTVKVTQNAESVGLPNSSIQLTHVKSLGNSFELNYTPDFTAATIYNISGQAVSSYELPTNGNLTIPTDNLAKGTYIVKFTGKATETVKVVR